jgi:hypothetical protein
MPVYLECRSIFLFVDFAPYLLIDEDIFFKEFLANVTKNHSG